MVHPNYNFLKAKASKIKNNYFKKIFMRKHFFAGFVVLGLALLQEVPQKEVTQIWED